MATQDTRPQSTLKSVGQFFENNFKKIQDLSNPTSLKKYLGKINKYFFGKELIFLDSDGTVLSWSESFRRLQGYSEKEILGQHLSIFYMPLEREQQLPQKLISQAAQQGSAIQKGKWVRKDGSTFFGRMVVRAIRSANTNELLGFSEELYPLSEETD